MNDQHSPNSGDGTDNLRGFRLGTGFQMSEREEIVAQFAPLGARLRSFDADTVDMELSVKERDGADQHVTLEIWVAGRERLVSMSSRGDLRAALQEVRDDSVRQLNDSVTRDERERHAPRG